MHGGLQTNEDADYSYLPRYITIRRPPPRHKSGVLKQLGSFMLICEQEVLPITNLKYEWYT